VGLVEQGGAADEPSELRRASVQAHRWAALDQRAAAQAVLLTPGPRQASTLALLGDGRPWVCGRVSDVWPVLHLGPPLVAALGRAAWHLEIRQAVKAERGKSVRVTWRRREAAHLSGEQLRERDGSGVL
jgi:hypothetical protein